MDVEHCAHPRNAGEVIGCVYIYPSWVRSWVRADRADLDKPLYEAVRDWLATWPLTEKLSYAPRD